LRAVIRDPGDPGELEGGRMRAPTAVERLSTVALIGLVAGFVAMFFAPWQFAALVAWNAAAGVFVVWVWITVGRFTPTETRAHATREDTNRVLTSLLLVGASLASLVGTGLDLMKASDAHDAGRVVLTIIGLLTVTLSWLVVHSVFALHYAHEFYTEPVGGIDFKTDAEDPDYRDFAYLAFTIGMTFQVSDTDIQVRRIRRTVLRHAFIAYLFGAVILAVVVNLIASMVK
jgi:uncharacterized membrane protein